jgi:hypothetical protein
VLENCRHDLYDFLGCLGRSAIVAAEQLSRAFGCRVARGVPWGAGGGEEAGRVDHDSFTGGGGDLVLRGMAPL